MLRLDLRQAVIVGAVGFADGIGVGADSRKIEVTASGRMRLGRLDLGAGPMDESIGLAAVGPTAVVAQQVWRRAPPEGGVTRGRPSDCSPEVPQRQKALIGGHASPATDQVIDQGVSEASKVDRLPVRENFGIDSSLHEEGIKRLLPCGKRAAARQIQDWPANATQRR